MEEVSRFRNFINLRLHRREFVKRSVGSILATSALSSSVISSLFPAEARADLNISDFADLLSFDPRTLEYKVFGPCCYFCPDHLIVNHYQPVILVEVIRGGADSVVVGKGSKSSAVQGMAVHTKHLKNFAVRIWEIPNWAIDMAMAFQSCKLCGKNAAPKSMGSMGSSFLSSFCSADGLMNTALSQINDALPDCFPKLLYDSYLDTDWRTGCTDLQRMTDSLKGMSCSKNRSAIKSLASSAFGQDDYCIGEWGPLYPRQMAWKMEDPRLAAAISATRALSLAGEKGYLSYSTDINLGKLQLTLPEATVGYRPGSKEGRDELEDVDSSETGVYSFVWWLPVTCCKEISEIIGFCSPNISCSS